MTDWPFHFSFDAHAPHSPISTVMNFPFLMLLLLAILGLAVLKRCAAIEDVKRSLRKVVMGKELTLIASATAEDAKDLYPFSQTGGVVLSRLTGASIYRGCLF